MSVLGLVALPGGRPEPSTVGPTKREVALLRVLLVPRLTEPLEQTEMADWPAVVNGAPLTVTTTVDGTSSTIPSTPRRRAKPETWRRFFGHGIEVTPWQPPPGYDAPTANSSQRLDGGPNSTLDDDQLIATSYGEVARRPGDKEQVRVQLAQWRDRPPPRREPTPGDPTFTRLDFHRAVSMLREHPYVLRALGLIVELELDPADLPRSTGEPYPQIQVSWPDAPIDIESPATAYEFDRDRALFLPAPSGDIRSGLVDLSDTDKWQVLTVDVDGAAAKLYGAAQTLVGTATNATADAARDATAEDPGPVDRSGEMPTLRSAGLQLARRNRLEQLSERAARGRANNAAGSLAGQVFHADDLVLGYRLDVRRQRRKTWSSLHERVATYHIDGEPVGDDGEIVEEGHLRPHAVVREGAAVRADDIVARWDGGSLAVPHLLSGGTAEPTAAAEDLIPYRFRATFWLDPARNNPLPELRFGDSYQLRARVVDLAGGGLPLEEPEPDVYATGQVPYTRYEPVPPPELVVPEGLLVPDPTGERPPHVDPSVLGPGGTLERLVVRTSPTQDGFTTTEFDDDPAYAANDRRTLTAPRTTFELAEQHNLLNDPGEAGWTLAQRANNAGPGDYLPDPLGQGLAVTLLPEPGGLDETKTDSRPWSGTWPDHDPKSIALVAGSNPHDEAALQWTGSGPEVTQVPRVVLPPAQRVVVELSSTILTGEVDTFAFKQLAASAQATDAAVNGQHPLLTPARRLELLHAVRRPLTPPSGSLTPSRPDAAATYADLAPEDALLGVDTPSTVQLDIRGDWDEWIDAPQPVPGTATLPPVPVARGAAALPAIRHEFGDTKHRWVRYTVTAISRYREFFAADDPETEFVQRTTFDAVPVRSSARPGPAAILSTVPAFRWSDESPGQGVVRRRRASGRLRIALDRPWYATGEGECIGVVVWPGSEEGVPPEVRPLVSWLNRDPIHPTPAAPALAAESLFEGAVDPVTVRLVETGHEARVLPYPVSWGDSGWYADIEIPRAAEASYCPFVQLAIVRFQRHSLENLRVSTVVRTEMIPLLPDRVLTVSGAGPPSALDVTLTGPSRDGDRPNRVVALIEACNTDDTPGAPVDLTSLTGNSPGFPTWTRVAGASVSGSTNEPLPRLLVPSGPRRLRLVVRETEDLDDTGPELVDAPRELTERTVYLDVLELPTL